MTVWPARAAAAIVFGLAFSPIVASAPSAAAAGQPAPVSVTMIAALTVPEHTTGFISSELLGSYTSEFGLLTRELNQVIDRPVVIGIDPSIIASIRILGTDAPASATAWLARLDAATNETFPLAWADADLTIGLQAGSDALLAPESYAYAINPSLFPGAEVEPTPTPDPTTTAEAEPVLPSLPTDESLVAWDYTVSSIAWPAMNTVTASNLGTLARSYETTILSSGNLATEVSNGAHITIDGESALVADEALSTLFSATVAAGSGPEWEAAMASLATSVGSVTSTVERPASVLLALNRGVAISDLDMGLTVSSLASSLNVNAVGIASLLSTSTTSATLLDSEHDADRITRVRALLGEEAADRVFAGIAADPSLITSKRRLELLATISNSWADNAVGWQAAVADYTAASATLRSSVKIVKSSSINLWADRAAFPVTVSNDLSQAITVFVTVRPLSPLLKVEDGFVAVTVEPNSQRKASIPVQSLSNGEVELAISLHSNTSMQVGDTTYVRTSVQAGWETPVTISFGVAVVLVFAFGIIRTIVRRRRSSES